MRWFAPSLLCLPFAAIAWAGCATSGVDDGLGDDDSGTGVEDDTGTTTPPPEKDAGADRASGGFDANPGPGFDAAPVDANPNPGDGSSASCTAQETCQTATDLGSVSGDSSSPAKTASGFASQWLQVKVTEDDNSVIGRKLNVSVTLTSPAGTNFDLYLYANTGGSPTDRACGTPSTQSTTTGTDVAKLNWGEGTAANGSDDTRIVSVEVRWVSGACAPGAKWTLTVNGN